MTSLFWLTRDFRFYDNAALCAAAAAGPVGAVFVVDSATRAIGAAARWRLEQALVTFDAAWKRRTGQHLTILYGEAAQVLPPLAQAMGAKAIHQNDWPCAPMRAAQNALRRALPSDVPLVLHEGHLLVHPRQVLTGAGTPYRVYSPFAKAVRRMDVARPLPAPPRITALPADAPAPLNLAPDMFRGGKALHQHALPAGEDAARDRLDDFLDRAGAYADTRNNPDVDGTSGLSDYLALGEISPRTVWSVGQMHSHAHPAASRGTDTFLGEMLWREFSWHLLIAFPNMATHSWRPEWDNFPWRKDNPEAEAWRRAATGISLVDAGLREMWVTGRMHNRVRMVVASWLTKHLLTDWRVGEAFFADCLTDWCPAANTMNWQWVAGCGPDASPFFRIFNPIRQAAEYDPKGTYRAHWLRGSGAVAFAEAVPRSWPVPIPYRPDEAEGRLRNGRDAALAAYATLKD